MGLEYTGIYRVPGNNAMVSSLQDQLNKGIDINPTEEVRNTASLIPASTLINTNTSITRAATHKDI